MSWLGKIIGGTLGFIFGGGPLGAIAGAVFGHYFIDKNIQAESDPDLLQTEQIQSTYFIALFSLLAKMAKADGQITKAEGDTLLKVINRMNLPPQSKQYALRIFNEAKYSPYTLEEFAQQYYSLIQGRRDILLSMLDMLFNIASADGQLHPAEEQALRNVQQIFHLTKNEYESIKSRFFADSDKYYKILNCTPESTNEEIKNSYRKLINEYHPDKIIARGLPEEFIDQATKRFQEVQDSYEHIRKERKF